LPFEEREEVNLNFYKILDEQDKDPKLKEMKKVVKIYTTPPPIPKRVDSVAKNIDQYFKQDLVQQADKARVMPILATIIFGIIFS